MGCREEQQSHPGDNRENQLHTTGLVPLPVVNTVQVDPQTTQVESKDTEPKQRGVKMREEITEPISGQRGRKGGRRDRVGLEKGGEEGGLQAVSQGAEIEQN